MALEKAFAQLDMNECPFCQSHTLCVSETENTIYNLSKYGSKEDLTETEYDAHIVCSSCGRKFNTTTIGGRWCIAEENPIKRNTDMLSFNPFDKKG